MPSDLVNSIVAAEENARESNEVIKDLLRKYRTHVVDWKDFIIDPVNGSYLFLTGKGNGKVEELVIISPTDDFSLSVEVDGILSYQGDFSRYAEVSIHISSIVAQQRGSNYILQLSDIAFLQNISIIIDPGSKTTFSRLYCKYKMAE